MIARFRSILPVEGLLHAIIRRKATVLKTEIRATFPTFAHSRKKTPQVMSDNKVIFSMEGVSKTFPPNKQVLNNIWLSFFYGAKIGVLGLNGSGKSTILKLIAGICEPTRGDVSVSGKVASGSDAIILSVPDLPK